MGETKLPRHMFLWCLSAIYMFAFASLYAQIPVLPTFIDQNNSVTEGGLLDWFFRMTNLWIGQRVVSVFCTLLFTTPRLYGNEGILPARWKLRVAGKSMWEQLTDLPSLLWFGPRLGLDTQHCMELLSLSGAVLSMAAMAIPPLRDCRVFLLLWVIYLSLYQVGQVFLYFQWDSLLLEVGFLAILIAPIKMPWGLRLGLHDNVTFWLGRWLLFRLMFASGVVKLTSRCPTWWGLTALTYHYETQCIPTPLAWFAHQLPVWFQKLSVVGTFVIEIAGPFLFFSPVRRHRLTAFYMQVLLQVLIVLSGNYNFFNLLTIALCVSLLDDEHVSFWLCRCASHTKKKSLQMLLGWVCVLLEVVGYALFGYWTVLYFDLKVDWEKKSISSKTVFTHYQFNSFLKTVTVPSIWIGVLSLTWEIITAMFRSACVKGMFWRLWSMMQWGIFSAAAASMFAITLVPYTYIKHEAHSNLWPGIRKAFELTHRYQLANSYGLFRRMTGVGGRPEVIVEGSMDGSTWTEIEFMYKPGNLSAAPKFVTPHQPRLDWQMWFASLGPQEQSPWFSSLILRLLQGKRDVIKLIQTDESRYPFHKEPPVYIRAQRYKYWFTEPKEDGTLPQKWWRRIYVEEFYPPVRIGDRFLESMLTHHGLNFKDKTHDRRGSGAWLPRTLKCVGEHVRDVPVTLLLWTLFSAAATVCLLNCLCPHTRLLFYTEQHPKRTLQYTEVVQGEKKNNKEHQKKRTKQKEHNKKKKGEKDHNQEEIDEEEPTNSDENEENNSLTQSLQALRGKQ